MVVGIMTGGYERPVEWLEAAVLWGLQPGVGEPHGGRHHDGCVCAPGQLTGWLAAVCPRIWKAD